MIRCCDHVTASAFAQLRELTQLQYLAIDGEQFDDGALSELSELSQLYRIDLERTAVTAGGLRHLAKLPKLRGVKLVKSRGIAGHVQQAGVDSRTAELHMPVVSVDDAGAID